MPLRGAVTHVSFDEIYGWARFSEDPYRVPVIQAVRDTVLVAEARADLMYDGFASMGGLVARCGFMLDLGRQPFRPGGIVTILADGIPLPGATVTIFARGPGDGIHVDASWVAHFPIAESGCYAVTAAESLVAAHIYSRARQMKADVRRLGLLVGGITADGQSLDMADSALFLAGFYALEHGAGGPARWTNGMATLGLARAGLRARDLRFTVHAVAADLGP